MMQSINPTVSWIDHVTGTGSDDDVNLEDVISASETPMTSQRSGELYVVMTMLLGFSLVGAAGNALVLYVFSKKKDTLVSTQCIIALATVDFFTCLVVIPYTIYMEFIDFRVSNDVACKVYQFLITSNIPFSALIMVAIALDRYLCICHPFVKVMTVDRAKIVICALWLFAAGLGTVVALMFGVYQRVPVPSSLSNTSITIDYDTASYWERFANNDTSLGHKWVAGNNNSLNYFSENSAVAAIREKLFLGVTDRTIGNVDSEIENVKNCQENDIILKWEFQLYYQKLYNTIFPLCLAIVVVLYVLIYRSVLVRRNKRQQQKSKSLGLVQARAAQDGRTLNESTTQDTLIASATTTMDANADTVRYSSTVGSKDGHATSTSCDVDSRAPRIANEGNRKAAAPEITRAAKTIDSNRMANLKTAVMLFVVNVVFVISFTPAFLMAIKIVPHNMVVFYLYFANNVANPVIYSFMNKNFRADLIRLFKH